MFGTVTFYFTMYVTLFSPMLHYCSVFGGGREVRKYYLSLKFEAHENS